MAKGQKTGGRQKGTPNKVTKIAKDAIALAAEMLGGVDRLVAWAKEDNKNESIFWGQIYTKLLPLQVAGDPDAPLEIINRIERAIVPATENAADRDAAGIPTTH